MSALGQRRTTTVACGEPEGVHARRGANRAFEPNIEARGGAGEGRAELGSMRQGVGADAALTHRKTSTKTAIYATWLTATMVAASGCNEPNPATPARPEATVQAVKNADDKMAREATATRADDQTMSAMALSPATAGLHFTRVERTIRGTWEAGTFTNISIVCWQKWYCIRPPGIYSADCTGTPSTTTTGACSAGGGPADSCNFCVASPPTQPCETHCPD
jgi:hypothetical protein